MGLILDKNSKPAKRNGLVICGVSSESAQT